MIFQQELPPLPFSQWLFRRPEGRRLLWLAGAVAVIHFTWFKILFPFPNIIPDSYRYIIAAVNDSFVDMRPIGYSRFLRLFSCFTTSDFMLVLFQYLVLQAAVFYFLCSVGYLFSPGRWMLRVLVALNAANPLLSHLSNLVTSDAIFTALSLTWFTQLLWMQYRPGWRLLLGHALILFFAFTLRYNALYYPFISAVAILLAPICLSSRMLTRFAFMGVLVLPLLAFTTITIRENKKVFGFDGFSAFGGWQLAANALTAYAHLPPDPPAALPPAFQSLHTLVNKHADSLNHLRRRPDYTMNIYYMWIDKSPLNVYMPYHRLGMYHPIFMQQWNRLGPLYGQYGNYMIRQHPGAFFRYFIRPNINHYFFPNAEFLGVYNAGSNKVSREAVDWFRWRDNKVYSAAGNKGMTYMDYFSFIQFMTNLVFALVFAGMALRRFPGIASPARKALWLTALVWAANMGFSIFSAIVILRYQVGTMILAACFSALLIQRFIRE